MPQNNDFPKSPWRQINIHHSFNFWYFSWCGVWYSIYLLQRQLISRAQYLFFLTRKEIIQRIPPRKFESSAKAPSGRIQLNSPLEHGVSSLHFNNHYRLEVLPPRGVFMLSEYSELGITNYYSLGFGSFVEFLMNENFKNKFECCRIFLDESRVSWRRAAEIPEE